MLRASFDFSPLVFLTVLFVSSDFVEGQVWVDWNDVTASNLVAAPSLGASDVEEKDYAVADFDQDGDMDLVCVRKLPFTTFGERQNVYFENTFGVLTDQTAIYAPGFLMPDNARDVMAADFDGDGWEDLIIANAGNDASNGQQPRIFMNRGVAAGSWLGFQEEASRLPLLFSPTGTEPNACAVGVGDVTGNGVADIYLVDYLNDVEDRLLINNGTGFFTDETASRIPTGFETSAFATAGMIADVNADGLMDIIKNTTPNVKVAYNAGGGFFNVQQDLPVAAAYHFDVGDLNGDGKNDLFIVQDGQDQYLLNNSGSGASPVSWTEVPVGNSPLTTGFGGNVYLADLDNDNDLDVTITDADTDVPSCFRRMAFLQSDGGTPAPVITDPYNTVYEPVHQEGTYDVAIADFDGDGSLDMVVGHCAGTNLYYQLPAAPPVLALENLTCVQSGLDVDFAWTNPQSYDSIEVFRDGASIVVLGGAVTSFTDSPPGAGQYSYTLRGSTATQSSGPTSCAIQVSTVNAVTSLACAQFDEDVQLTWVNAGGITGAPYDSIEVSRDGVLVATVPGTTTQYLDAAPALGTTLYVVVARIGADSSAPGTCVLNVAPGDATDLILDFAADDGGATNSAIALEESLLANGVVVNRVLIDLVTDLPGLNLDLNDFERVWVELGTFPSNKVLAPFEGQVLADYVTDGVGGRHLYMSGGDTFSADPQTSVHAINGVVATSDGFGSVANVRGLAGGTCNAILLEEVDYDGEDDIVDRLSTSTGEEILEANVTGNSFIAGIFQPVGDGAIISTSVELGGIGAPHDRSDLVEVYLHCFMLPPPVQFIRGDCSGNQSVQLPDAIVLLNYLFSFGASPSCFKACDVDDNGSLQLPDVIFLLNYLFAGGASLPAPFPGVGGDPTFDSLPCI